MINAARMCDYSFRSSAILLFSLIPAYPVSFGLAVLNFFFDFGVHVNPPSFQFLWCYAILGAIQLSSWRLLADAYIEATGGISPGVATEASLLGGPLFLTMGVAGSRTVAAVTLEPLIFFVFFLLGPVVIGGFLVNYCQSSVRYYWHYVAALVLSLAGILVFWGRLLF